MMSAQGGINKHVLITGRPGSGKTTIVKRLISNLGSFRPVGFYTEEIRERGERKGFEIVRLDGEQRLLSHVDISGEFRVGKYGVDVAGFDRFLDEIPFFDEVYDLVIIDEIGKMECLSMKFRQLVQAILEVRRKMLATVPINGGEFIMKIKKRPDVILYPIDRINRDLAAAEIKRALALSLTQ